MSLVEGNNGRGRVEADRRMTQVGGGEEQR